MPLSLASHGVNRAHDACNARRGRLVGGGKCGKPFGSREADMKVRGRCYPDGIPHEGHGDCARGVA